MMQQPRYTGITMLGLCLAVGIASGGYFVGQTMVNASTGVNTAEAKGLAQRRVTADQAGWSIQVAVTRTNGTALAEMRKTLDAATSDVTKALYACGLSPSEAQLDVTTKSTREYRDDKRRLLEKWIILSRSIEVSTTNVHAIIPARMEVSELIGEDFDIGSSAPTYHYTRLNEIKPEMLREATRNARIAASEFAKNAGVRVGRIRSATQGRFSVTDCGENYGDTQEIEKDVRVVTTITFYLTD